MNGKENIINKILSDADDKCAKILAAAEQNAASIKEQALIAAEADKQALNARVEALTAERIRNRVATAELDARKYGLAAKQRLITDCYDKALQIFVNMTAQDKQAFVTKLLIKYAEEGETARIAKADENVITQKVLDSVGLKLKLDTKFHSGVGGVVLLGNGYEKDLTLTSVIAYLREQTEGKVASTLFGE